MSSVRPSFRFATWNDLPGIKRLWLEETDWGALPEEFMQQWEAAPGGSPRTLIAVNEVDGSVIGQFGFLPLTIKVGDRHVSGVRPHSTIVSKTYRDSIKTLDLAEQPSAAMYANGLRQLREEGVKIAYMVPHPRWTGLFRFQPMAQLKTFPLHSLQFPLDSAFALPDGWSAYEIESWGASIDDLCERWSPQYQCGIVRTAQVLAWKARIGEHRSLAVHRRGELAGVVISKIKGDRMWQVCDMITADDSDALKATLIAAILDGARFGDDAGLPPEKKMRKTSILATPLMQPVLAELGFSRDDWNFPLVVERLDDSISADDVAPEKWYVAADD